MSLKTNLPTKGCTRLLPVLYCPVTSRIFGQAITTIIESLFFSSNAEYIVRVIFSTVDPGEVFDAIQSVHTKGSYINGCALKALQKNINKKAKSRPVLHDARLTRREEEILELVCQQLTAEEIAEKLFISVKTVNGHRTNLLEKTGAKNVTDLVIYASRNNIVTIQGSRLSQSTHGKSYIPFSALC